MNGPANPRDSTHWRQAVWGLRTMFPGLAAALLGLMWLTQSTSTGQAILAVGMGVYLFGVVVTVSGIVLVYRELSPARPNFLNLRWYLIQDAVHARSVRGGEPEDVLTGRHAPPPDLESLRGNAHWRPAVRGIRLMGVGVVVAVAGLVALPASYGKVLLVVGFALYLAGALLTFVQAHRAYAEAQPHSDYAMLHRMLLRDAFRGAAHRQG